MVLCNLTEAETRGGEGKWWILIHLRRKRKRERELNSGSVKLVSSICTVEKIKIKLFNQRFTYYTREIYPLRREIEKNRIKKIVISTISFYW